jgi:hypothetical protein
MAFPADVSEQPIGRIFEFHNCFAREVSRSEEIELPIVAAWLNGPEREGTNNLQTR